MKNLKSKKLVALLVLCALVSLIFCGVASAQFGVQGPAYIAGDNINLRAGASNDAEVITTLNKGTQVHVMYYAKMWYQVKVRSTGQTGWVWCDFVNGIYD